MSVARVLRFLFGTIVGGILLAIVLPFVGVPSSHFLPPPHVWERAQSYAKGVVTDKFYSVTSNPFDVNGHIDFVEYQFYAKAPITDPQAGKARLYTGQVRLDKAGYDAVAIPKGSASTQDVKEDIKIAVVPGQNVRVRYEPTDPTINGPVALAMENGWMAWGGRSVTGASNMFSGWLVWIVVAVVLGYVFMLVMERFSAQENI